MPCKKLFASLLFLGLLSSCALKSPSTGLTKYQQAVSYYEAKKYYKASPLFKEALPLLRGKKEESSIHFYQAYCLFHKRNYVESSDHFKYFRETFVRDPRQEEALYMQAHALYKTSPYVELDQALTQEAVSVLQSYLDHYPAGTYENQASAQLAELTHKLASKAFSIAKLYHQLGRYRAAVITFGRFQQEFPTSSYSEEAAYLKVDAQYRYFQEVQQAYEKAQSRLSVACHKEKPQPMVSEANKTPEVAKDALGTTQEEKKEPYSFEGHKRSYGESRYAAEQQEIERQDQLRTTIKYCQEFLDHYPDSRYAAAVGKIYAHATTVSKPVKQNPKS